MKRNLTSDHEFAPVLIGDHLCSERTELKMMLKDLCGGYVLEEGAQNENDVNGTTVIPLHTNLILLTAELVSWNSSYGGTVFPI